MSSQSHELETSSVADRDTTTTPPPTGGGSQTGAQESPSTSDIKLEYDVTSYHLIKARVKQCPTTLRKEDQSMTLLENRKECLVSRDEMKVMIARDHAQHVAIRQEDQTMKTPGMV